jgi:hypothetical protein
MNTWGHADIFLSILDGWQENSFPLGRNNSGAAASVAMLTRACTYIKGLREDLITSDHAPVKPLSKCGHYS